jgi:ribosomal protein S18 acetylase RimI-like enzyme
MQIEINYAYDNLAIVKQLFREYTQYLNVDLSYQNYDGELASLPGQYALPDGRLYLATVDGAAAGCIALRKVNETRCEMKRLYVRENFRGLKLGRQLAQKVIDDARTAGFQELVLDTYHFLTNAIRMYEKMGFEPIAPYYENPDADKVLFFRLYL